jgi:hypothetical protein
MQNSLVVLLLIGQVFSREVTRLGLRNGQVKLFTENLFKEINMLLQER